MEAKFGFGPPLPTANPQLFGQVFLREWQWNTRKKFVGLADLGRTSFMNSVIQCMQCIPAWSNYLWSKHLKECTKGYDSCFACMVAHATLLMKRKDDKAFVPKILVKNLHLLSSDYEPGNMLDAHTFLTCFLARVQESVIKGEVDPYLEMTTAVGQIFGGFLRRQVACQECMKTDNTYEKYFNISLDVEGVTSMQAALDKFFSIDEFFHACARCERQTKTAKRCTIETNPEVLIFHFDRYDAFEAKLDHLVEFTEFLNVAKYSSSIKSSRPYKLNGVVCHVGSSPTRGHYSSFVTDPDCERKRWLRIDDKQVSPSEWPEVVTRTAYLLFYIKDDCWDFCPHEARAEVNIEIETETMSEEQNSKILYDHADEGYDGDDEREEEDDDDRC